MRLSRVRALSIVAVAYITVFRSIPMLALILLFYNIAALYPRIGFGTASVSTNSVVTPWVAAVVALVLHETAYVAETIRAGIISIQKGQREAALALGLNEGQAFRKVILPQALRVIIPPMGNLTIALMKATSLVSVIAVSDLLHSVQVIYANTFQTIPLLIVAVIWYFVLTSTLTVAQTYLERRLEQSPTAARARVSQTLEVEA